MLTELIRTYVNNYLLVSDADAAQELYEDVKNILETKQHTEIENIANIKLLQNDTFFLGSKCVNTKSNLGSDEFGRPIQVKIFKSPTRESNAIKELQLEDPKVSLVPTKFYIVEQSKRSFFT